MSDEPDLTGDLSAEGLREGAVFAGRFRIERRLGKGGMGVVLAARHLGLDTPVAIKLLLPGTLGSGEAVTRFLREARAAARLRSEHVARITDVDALPSGEPYVVMEYLSGRDLAAALEERGPLPVADAVDYVIQACDAIAEAHVLGIVHRDLKPGNLFLTRRPDGAPLVKVLDFGVAKAPRSNDSEELTGTHAMLGSPLYMAPEQIVSARDVDSRADVWALGAILYELLCARPPFVAATLQDLARQIMTEAPRPPTRWRTDLPAPLTATILECLTRDRSQRVQNVGELAEALAPFAPAASQPLVASIKRVLASGVATGTQSARAPIGVFPSRERDAAPVVAAPAPADFASTLERSPTEPAARGDDFAEQDPTAVTVPPPAAPAVSPYDPTEENLLSDSDRKTRVQLRPGARRSRAPLLIAGFVVVAVAAGVVGVSTRSPTPAPAGPPAVLTDLGHDAAAVAPAAVDAGRAQAPAVDAAPVARPAAADAAVTPPAPRPAVKAPGRRKPPERKAPKPTPYDSRR